MVTPDLIGFARWWWSLPLLWLNARGRASRMLTAGIDELASSVRLRGEDTLPAEMLGMMYLAQAQRAARGQAGRRRAGTSGRGGEDRCADRGVQRNAHALRPDQYRAVAVGGGYRAR